MNKSTSAYLDFLRVFSAFGVLITHAEAPWFSNVIVHPKQDIGNKLVMIFFVLSGYLISYTVDVKNKGSHKYLVDRFSRLYSVVLPALVITFILDFAGKHYNAAFYVTKLASNQQFARYFLNFSFLAQSWGICTNPGTNAAFWSISYEFWYYIIFWIWIYKNGKWKFIWLLIICALISVKIIILFPVWILGVIAYKYSNKCKYSLNKYVALTLFLSTFLSVICLIFFSNLSFLSNRFVYGNPPLFYSSNFIINWIYGVLVSINIWSFSFISSLINFPALIDKIIKKLSSVTFSLYLYHFPMLIFAAAVIPYNKHSFLQVGLILICLVAIVIVISEITEKQRKYFKTSIELIFSFFKNKISTKRTNF